MPANSSTRLPAPRRPVLQIPILLVPSFTLSDEHYSSAIFSLNWNNKTGVEVLFSLSDGSQAGESIVRNFCSQLPQDAHGTAPKK
jgi:hypothetical protein